LAHWFIFLVDLLANCKSLAQGRKERGNFAANSQGQFADIDAVKLFCGSCMSGRYGLGVRLCCEF
jgi:hypothetical protein